ncbi:MAG: phosphotransferase [Halieaceae bacterium]|nr:phosphotransferase [Halieaceae bacterium]
MSAPKVSNDWLEQALGANKNSLKAVDWHKVGTGQVAASYRGCLDWSPVNSEPIESVVMKCPSEDPTSRATSLEFGLYEKEIFWYQQLRQRSLINCPHCYGSWFKADDGDFQLLLQDCSPAEQGDQLQGASVEQVLSGVKELAYLHAPFVGDEALAQHHLFAKDHAMKDIRIALYAEFWPEFKRRYQDRIAADILGMGDVIAAHYAELEQRQPKLSTLVHGDFRLDNLLFNDRVERPFVLDWQTLAIGCPMKDVAYFIGTSLADPAVRRSHEITIVNSYFDTLESQGLAVNRSVLLAEYRLQAISGLIMAVFSSMLVERTERGDEMFAVMAERPGRQALELGSLELLAY